MPTTPLTHKEGNQGIRPDDVALGVEESLWPKLPGARSQHGVKVYRVNVRNHHGALGNAVALQCDVTGGGVREAEGGDIREALALQDGGLQVGHEGPVVDGGSGAAGAHGIDLLTNALLHVRPAHEEYEKPPQGGARGFRAAHQQIPNQLQQLVI